MKPREGTAKRALPISAASSAVFLLMAIAIGCYYEWGVRAAGYEINWGQDGNGYYNYLARAFVGGHLYLSIEPSPQLLAQPNPWDPKVDDSLKLFDAVLFNRHYYVYQGAGPAVMLFAPWRLLTGHDLPENFALFLLCFGGYLFSAGALLGILHLAHARIAPGMLAVMFLALGTCQSVPFLLNRVWVYELADGGGYFCLSGALFFLVLSFLSKRFSWLAASGFMFGMAISCRPHLGIAGVIALLAMAFSSRQRLIAFSTPFILVGLAVATYNYARFGDFLEFGNSYLLGGPNQTRVHLSTANVSPGMYYLIFAQPRFSPVFPWVRLPSPPRDFPRPSTYTVEPVIGALFLAPFLPGVLLIWFAGRARWLLWIFTLSGFLILLFLTGTGWSTQRYEVDFLPILVLASLGGCVIAIARSGRAMRWALCSVMGLSITFGTVINTALGLSGPYDEMLKNKPARFVRIASWFSPVEKYRPMLNPGIAVHLAAVIRPGPDHFRQDLFTAGGVPYRYELFVEHIAGKPNLVSRYSQSTIMREVAESDKPIDLQVTYSPQRGEIHVNGKDGVLIEQKIGPLVTAPSQIVVIRQPSTGS